MKKAVIFGGGNIGRGLAGRIFHEAGLEVVFSDVNEKLITALNEKHSYPLYVTMGDDYEKREVTGVRGIDGRDLEAIFRETDDAYICATAIGVNILPIIARTIAAIIKHRYETKNTTPLNFILCENKINVHLYMRELLRDMLTPEEYAFSEKYIGFCQSSIGCMVPAPPKEIIEKNPLTICVENYNKIYTDKSGAVGEFPEIPNLIAYEPFELYINRKLFMHNMSHSLTAYFGFIKGYKYIWEAVSDPEIKAAAMSALNEAASAMSKHYKVDKSEFDRHAEDLVKRYGNKLLGDTIARVGGDPKRKLNPCDRLVGAALFCLENGVEPKAIARGIAYGYRFAPEGDPTAAEIQNYIKEHSLDEAMKTYSGIEKGDKLYELVKEYC